MAGVPAGPSLPRVDLRSLIRLRLGDEAVKEAFVQTWAPLVQTEAKRYARRGGSAEDLNAEGMLALWEAALHYDAGRHRTAPERFIHNQVHRRVREAYRRSMSFEAPAQVPLELVPNAGASETGFTAAEERTDLEAAAGGLAPAERETFTRYARLAAAGAGPDEAARALAGSGGVGFAAWKKRIERVRKKLRNQLSGVPSGPA